MSSSALSHGAFGALLRRLARLQPSDEGLANLAHLRTTLDWRVCA